jgi:hypothetical protein
MTTSKGGPQYYQLVIYGNSPGVDIWLGDEDGHFVQKSEGELHTSLLAGTYIVEFGLGSRCYPINLSEHTRLTQNEIEAEPSCERPKPDIGE